MFYELAEVYSADPKGIVILDATNRNIDFRINSVKELRTHFDEVDLVLFDIPKDIVIKQNFERDFPVPLEVLEDYFANFQLPQKEDYEFFQNVYIATGENEEEIVDLI